MPKRKHITELAFNLASQGVMILHPKDIDRVEEQSEEIKTLAKDCHIYLIAKRPRLAFVPQSIVWKEGNTHGKMCYYREGERIEVGFHMVGEPNGTIEYGAYPHRSISLNTPEGKVGPLPAHLISLICDELDDPSLRDLEVVYVGMSYGDGTRSARDRLKSHSTLQRVLADMNADEPEQEALIIMVQYAPPISFISFDGRDKTLKLNEDRDVMADLKKQQQLIDGKSQIALAEAGLIRYFRPHYNDKYKNNFPDRAHVITDPLYSIDFIAFSVELNTEELNLRLFNEHRRPGYHHIAKFDLHDPEVRRSFFVLMESSSSLNAELLSGPFY